MADKKMDEIEMNTPCERKHCKDKIKVLLVGKCILRETGNAATLYRFRLHIESSGYDCVMMDPEKFHDQELQDFVNGQHVSVVVGLHLYRCATVLLACKELGMPYICFFGGTDINEDVKSPEKLEIMTNVVFAARRLISFSKAMKDIAFNVWPSLNQAMVDVIPQAISVDPNRHFDLGSYINSFHIHLKKSSSEIESAHRREETYNCNSRMLLDGDKDVYKELITENEDHDERTPLENSELVKNSRMLLKSSHFICQCCFTSDDAPDRLPEEYHPLLVLVAGLRPVKDVLHVAEAWSKWQDERGKGGLLLIIGPIIDAQYAEEVNSCAKRLKSVIVADKLSPGDCQQVIRYATALINTSKSEGMSAAILEAMSLGTPVLARDIPGNSAVIDHGENGLLYDSPESFLEQLNLLVEDPGLSGYLASKAKEYIHYNHCGQLERKRIMEIIQDIIAT